MGITREPGKDPSARRPRCRLRRAFVERYGRAVYGDRQFAVLGVVIRDPIETSPPRDSELVATRTIRWDELAEFLGHHQLIPHPGTTPGSSR